MQKTLLLGSGMGVGKKTNIKQLEQVIAIVSGSDKCCEKNER